MRQPIRALILLLAIGTVVAAIFLLRSPVQSDTGVLTTNFSSNHVTEQPVVNYGLPVRLKIPKINIDAAIGQMGLTPEGDMAAPSGLQDVGWYKFGPPPGNKGSAVIAGHYGWRNKEASIFNALHTLGTGDIVQTTDEKGVVATFGVRDILIYDKNANVSEVFSSSDEKAHLNLVTCQGTWDNAQKTYTDRIVVFTDIKEQYDFP